MFLRIEDNGRIYNKIKKISELEISVLQTQKSFSFFSFFSGELIAIQRGEKKYIFERLYL